MSTADISEALNWSIDIWVFYFYVIIVSHFIGNFITSWRHIQIKGNWSYCVVPWSLQINSKFSRLIILAGRRMDVIIHSRWRFLTPGFINENDAWNCSLFIHSKPVLNVFQWTIEFTIATKFVSLIDSHLFQTLLCWSQMFVFKQFIVLISLSCAIFVWFYENFLSWISLISFSYGVDTQATAKVSRPLENWVNWFNIFLVYVTKLWHKIAYEGWVISVFFRDLFLQFFALVVFVKAYWKATTTQNIVFLTVCISRIYLLGS